jgi:NADH-quinone oxidoreductase subunit N
MSFVPISFIISDFDQLFFKSVNFGISENFDLILKLDEFVIFWGNDLKVLLPELFLSASILCLILYSINLGTETKYNYPLINSSLSWLTFIVLILTFILEQNNVIMLKVILNNIFVCDDLADVAKSILLLFTASYVLISKKHINNSRLNSFEYYILVLFSILGLIILVSSYDLLLTYLAIEMQSLSFYVLATFKKNSAFSTEAGLKYFILGAFSSSLILFGSSLIYGFTGTINFGDLSSLLVGINDNFNFLFGSNVLKVAITFVGVGLLFKLGAGPFHVWLPDVYEGAPTSSTALFAIIPKLAIFVIFFRLFQFSFSSLMESWQQIVVFSAIFSLLIGSFVALKQRKIKRLLAFSAINHVGYLLIAFSTGTLEGYQALFFYLYIYMITSVSIWALIMSLELQAKIKSSEKNLSDFSVLVSSNRILSITFAIILFSLGGVPPLAGFYAKMQIFFVSINSSMYILTILGILSSVISTFYYIRVIKVMYFEKRVLWIFYRPISQFKSLVIGIYSFLVFLLFLDPHLPNFFAYKMVTSVFV